MLNFVLLISIQSIISQIKDRILSNNETDSLIF